MSKGIRALAIAACLLAVVCGAAWAAHTYQEHFTLSELTSDYKAHYGQASRTRFGGFALHGLSLSSGPSTPTYGPDDIITITPNGTAFIAYVKQSEYRSGYGFLHFKTSDLQSQKTTSSDITHKLVYWSEQSVQGTRSDVMLANDAGDIAIFGLLGDVATQSALNSADYSITIGGKTETGNLPSLLSTEQQLANAAVPYVEFKTDASGKVQSVMWRAVKASDPSTAVEYKDVNTGVFSLATSFSTLKTSALLKDGREVGLGGTDTPISSEGKIEWTATLSNDFKLQDIVYVNIRNDRDYQWVFYPPTSGGGDSPDVVSPDTPPYIPPSGTPGGIPSISNGDVSFTPIPGVTGASCIGAHRPSPPGFGRPSMSDPSNVGTITIINTIQLMVNYDTNTLAPGATVTFTINNFSYRPKGKLFACAKNKHSGAWDRFPITSTMSSISFSLPVLAYFSTSDVVIADIETTDTDTGGDGSSGGGGCAIGVGIAALAALAVIGRRKR